MPAKGMVFGLPFTLPVFRSQKLIQTEHEKTASPFSSMPSCPGFCAGFSSWYHPGKDWRKTGISGANRT
jgi:hypothetical protein